MLHKDANQRLTKREAHPLGSRREPNAATARCCNAGCGVVSPACLPVSPSLCGRMPDAVTPGCLPSLCGQIDDAGSAASQHLAYRRDWRQAGDTRRHSIWYATAETGRHRKKRTPPRSQRHSIWHLTAETLKGKTPAPTYTLSRRRSRDWETQENKRETRPRSQHLGPVVGSCLPSQML